MTNTTRPQVTQVPSAVVRDWVPVVDVVPRGFRFDHFGSEPGRPEVWRFYHNARTGRYVVIWADDDRRNRAAS
jgi:hypothetical protein